MQENKRKLNRSQPIADLQFVHLLWTAKKFLTEILSPDPEARLRGLQLPFKDFTQFHWTTKQNNCTMAIKGQSRANQVRDAGPNPFLLLKKSSALMERS